MHHLFSTELNTLNFTFAFTSSTYSWVVDFGHYFSPKSTLRLIRESTRTRVYTVSLWYIKSQNSHFYFLPSVALLSFCGPCTCRNKLLYSPPLQNLIN